MIMMMMIIIMRIATTAAVLLYPFSLTYASATLIVGDVITENSLELL
jgi:tryptophan-rich sensory protein